MALEAKKIRQAIKALLFENTDAGDRVYISRDEPRLSGQFPSIVIYTRGRSSEVYEDSPRSYRHRFRVAIELECEVLADQFPDNACDELAEQVEQILFKFPTLKSGSLHLAAWGGMPVEDEIETDAKGELLAAAARLTWEYSTLQEVGEEQEGDLDQLETVHADWNLDPVDTLVEATDDTKPPQT